ncbi:TetR/AcrR family transcriptional regulator [Plantibacter cousiniae (nom. nud.)]|uniref:TetR/AcrR family transcriptional regulator n=1 Tax=Plantibacter cousiniae (nom. nud.) TaxID=199709 RepID=UPI001E06E93F|nr:TetR/AcrR family transcriptional regulator [Plantibacter cousiniae]CAH0201917.1 putative HTH-type transcriptional regulator Rv1255c [Plantibacter cousiniae]
MTVDTPELAPLTPGARRVLDAASVLFYENGIHAVGVDTIAEAAGVTKKTLYDRFGSKEALVLSYLQHRDARWRVWVDEFLARHPEPGIDRVLAIFDAAIGWSDDNSPKGCSAVNARAEIPDHATSGLVLPEVTRQKLWLLDRFAELITEAGLSDPGARARELMLLYEGAIVTVGMRTFREPFETARAIARRLLAA